MMKHAFILGFLFLIGYSSFAQDLELRTVVQRGHEAPILEAVFSQSGKYVATASKDHTVIIWEARSGRQLRTLYGHNAPVNAVDFHPKENVLVSAGDDKQVIVWDLMSGSKLVEHSWSQWVSSIAFSPSGDQLLIGGGKYEVELLDWQKKETLRKFKVNKTQYGVEVGFDSSGAILTGNDDGKLIVYGSNEDTPLDTLRNIRASSCGGCPLRFDMDGKLMASVARSGPVTLWNWDTKEVNREFGEADNDYEKVAVGGPFVFAEDEKRVTQWRQSGEELRVFAENKEGLTGIKLSPNDSVLMTFGNDRVARLWDVYSGQLITELSGYLNRENDRGLSFGRNSYWHSNFNKYLSIRNRVKLSPDGKTVVRGHHNSEAYLWDTNSGRVKLELKGHDKMVVDYVFTKDSRFVYTAGGDRVIRLWDVQTGEELRRFEGHRDLVFNLALSEDGHSLASGSWDGSAILWDTGTGEILNQYRFPNNSPYTMAFAYHDQYLLIGTLDKKLQLIELDSGEPFISYIGHTDVITDLEIRGEEIISSSLDGMIKKWELKTGFQSMKFKGHTGAVYDVCYDTHGLYMASGGLDKVVRVWDLNTGKELKQLEGHTGAVTGVQFINDDRVLVSSSLDGTTRYWDMESGMEIVSHVFLGSRDWLTKSARGYFDATEAARENIFFVKGLKSYSLDQFFEEFYRPDIMKKSLELGADIHFDSDLKQKLLDFPPPSVEIVSPTGGEKTDKAEIDVVVKLTNRGGGIDELRLLHNGKRVLGQDRSLPEEYKNKKAIYKHVPLTLVPGRNEIAVSAFSEARIESDIMTREITYEGTASSITCHVVAIGINTYKNPILNLNYAKDDAEGFGELIKKKGKDLYDEIAFYPLYDEDASKENILKVLDEVAAKAKSEDVLIVYYAGHGSTVEGDFYFIPTENVRLYDAKKLKANAIYAGEVQQKLAKIPALKQMVVIDACQSGSSTQLLASRGAQEEKALAQLSRSTGVHILAASGSEQFASEFKELGHGLFTYVLLEALNGGADGAPKDGKVTIYELKSYLDDQVPSYSIKFKGKPQFPVTYSQGQDFPIVVD
ncbi:caspase family protein [Reichenbachiella ulvae]|uniref:Caspase family protein n=1 Tax=Reichenbachiella ulvae TaxID=2980104 RepID=A0ABT3CSV4_9BACT|nr:caspase family protein [Reichenbachiella ulvae]MCV9386763.1 caspase family protein [Reichenbachiella ulvae]